MKSMLRMALFVAAAVTTSSVAPAKTGPDLEPIAFEGSAILPATVIANPALDGVALDPITIDTVSLLTEDAIDTAEAIEPELPTDLNGLVANFAGTTPRDAQMDCLARAVYFESRGEPLLGQLAVGEVIANRSRSGRWPASYCGVVKQRSQFSFVRNGAIPEPNRGSSAWRTAVAIARIVDGSHIESKVSDALFFHARRVNPGWRLTRLGTVGNHVFYQ